MKRDRSSPRRRFEPNGGEYVRQFLMGIDNVIRRNTSTSGIMCGGLNGWPSTMRSGRFAVSWMELIRIPDELVAINACLGTAASMLAMRSRLTSSRSGPFSWTKSTPDGASARFLLNESRPCDAVSERPSFSGVGQ